MRRSYRIRCIRLQPTEDQSSPRPGPPTQRSRSRLRRRAGPSVSPSPSWRQKQHRRWSRGSGSGRRHTPSFLSSRSTSSSLGRGAACPPPRGSVMRRLQRHQREGFRRFTPWRDEDEDEDDESSPPPPGTARGRGFSFTVTCQSKCWIKEYTQPTRANQTRPSIDQLIHRSIHPHQ